MRTTTPTVNIAVSWIENSIETKSRRQLGLSTVAKVLSKLDGHRRRIGWAVATSFSEGAGLTTACLVVASPEVIVIGIKEGSKQRASPGRAWSELAPWRPDATGFDKRLQDWLQSTNPDRISLPASAKSELVNELRLAHKRKAQSRYTTERNEAFLDGLDKHGKRALRPLALIDSSKNRSSSTPKPAPKTTIDPAEPLLFHENGRTFRYENGYRVYTDTKAL